MRRTMSMLAAKGAFACEAAVRSLSMKFVDRRWISPNSHGIVEDNRRLGGWRGTDANPDLGKERTDCGPYFLIVQEVIGDAILDK